MRTLGILLFGSLGLLLFSMGVAAAYAREWAALVGFTCALLWVAAVLDMAMNRTMSEEDRRRFGPSAAWGGWFFWGVYFRSRRRHRRAGKRGNE